MKKPLPLLALLALSLVLAAGCSSEGGAESNEGADMTGATTKPSALPSSVPKGIGGPQGTPKRGS